MEHPSFFLIRRSFPRPGRPPLVEDPELEVEVGLGLQIALHLIDADCVGLLAASFFMASL